MGDASRYRVPAGLHRVEETIRRSRFITTVAPAPDTASAHAFVGRVRAEFPDATHNCWAFVAGPPGSTEHIGMSDDGEPHGTAGRPMLNALLHGNVGDIAAVCTRYFGGVKLGTGGLSRGYAGGIKSVLASLPTVERIERVGVVVTMGYAEVDALRRLVTDSDAVIEDEEYGADVRFRVGVPVSGLEGFKQGVAGLSQGRARVEEA